jgi:hypothetical protein
MVKFSISGFLVLILLTQTCSRKEHKAVSVKASPADTVTTHRELVVDFDADVKPFLQRRCSPCHFPGGSMYSKMPFDKPQTIRDHPEGILKRIKDEDELAKLKAFLEKQ